MVEKVAQSGIFFTDETYDLISKNTLDGLYVAHPQDRHTLIIGPEDFSEGQANPSLSKYFNDIGLDRSSEFGQEIENFFSFSSGSGMALSGKLLSPLMDNFAENACMITIPMSGGEIELENGSIFDLRYAQSFAAAQIVIDPLWFEKETLPGIGNDLQSWVAHHESDHCDNLNSSHAEYESDSHANTRYAQDLQAGRVQDPELPYFIRTQRAAGQIVGNEGERYVTTPLTPLAGEPSLSAIELSIAAAEINQSKDMIYNSIESKIGAELSTFTEGDLPVDRARMIYEESRSMLERGEFDTMPFGKTTVERFVEGAERYGHGLYNVAPENMRFDAPQMPPAAYGHSLPTFAAHINKGGADINQLEF